MLFVVRRVHCEWPGVVCVRHINVQSGWPNQMSAAQRYEFLLDAARALLARLDCNVHAIQPLLPVDSDDTLREGSQFLRANVLL